MTTGVLRWADMRAAINLNTGFFETSQYAFYDQMRVIAGNWDGAGMSVGNLQINWGPANRLTEFYNYLLNNHDEMVRTVFGARTDLYEEFTSLEVLRGNEVGHRIHRCKADATLLASAGSWSGGCRDTETDNS